MVPRFLNWLRRNPSWAASIIDYCLFATGIAIAIISAVQPLGNKTIVSVSKVSSTIAHPAPSQSN
jgi:Flp pilus assembly pilin Flp